MNRIGCVGEGRKWRKESIGGRRRSRISVGWGGRGREAELSKDPCDL